MSAVDHGVPIPPRRGRHRGRPPKYPWKELEKVGDTFFVEGATRVGFTAGVSAAGKAHGMQFETREVLEHDSEGNLVLGVRVWRTA